MPLTVGSLFAGIGGFDLAAERCGMEVKWQVEIDDYATKVLEKHWPHVRRYRDIRRCHSVVIAESLRSAAGRAAQCGADLTDADFNFDGLEPVDIICGGFPCQDISSAGAKAGLSGEQSGLWFEMARVVRELRPRYVVVENVADLLSRGLGTVLGDLAACGYDAEWNCLQAAAVGAPHGRDRLWIVAYPHADEGRCQVRGERDGAQIPGASDGYSRWHRAHGLRADVSDAHLAAEAARSRRWTRARVDFERWRADARQRAGWETEPAICRVADGVSPGVDNARLAALGNSVVPQIPEWIFRQIQAADEALKASA
jgi:DNA (cytosine-5)-methyltransferase 1